MTSPLITLDHLRRKPLRRIFPTLRLRVMTQPEALPLDPFPDLALVYDTPAVKAIRLEPGRYLTVDLDGLEISWLFDTDEEVIAAARYIDHCIVCREEDCELCDQQLDTEHAESIVQFGDRLQPPADPDAPAG